MGTLVKGKFTIITAVAVLILCVTSQIALVAANAAYQDEFNSATLQTGWVFTNPAKTGSYSLGTGYLTITAGPNSRMGTTSDSNENAPRMLQPVTGDFEATTYVTSTSSFSTSYRGGILLWKDSSNFIAVETYDSNKAMIYTGATAKYTQTPSFTATSGLYLRMVKSGTTVTGYYSTDTKTWTKIDSFSFPYGSTELLQIGLFTFNGDSGNFPAEFDFFRIDPHSTLSVLPEYPVGVFGAAAAIAGAYVFFKAKDRAKPALRL